VSKYRASIHISANTSGGVSSGRTEPYYLERGLAGGEQLIEKRGIYPGVANARAPEGKKGVAESDLFKNLPFSN